MMLLMLLLPMKLLLLLLLANSLLGCQTLPQREREGSMRLVGERGGSPKRARGAGPQRRCDGLLRLQQPVLPA